MIFQTLDDKSECVGIYHDGDLMFDSDQFPEGLSCTWKYTPALRDWDGIRFANLYLEGAPLSEHLPEYLLDDWADVQNRLASFLRSLSIAQVDLRDHCIYDVTPSRFLKEFGRVRNSMTQYVLQNIEEPPRYSYLEKVCRLLSDIKERPLKINKKRLASYSAVSKNKPILKQLKAKESFIDYNQFGTKTGRLTTSGHSFPLLTLRKDLRSIVEPTNDFYVELDFNGAEVRVLMGLLGLKQPDVDVHTFHCQEVFGGELSREEAKVAFFAWLYGSRSSKTLEYSKQLESYYRKDTLLDQFWDGSTVLTPFGKRIKEVDEHHALNYLIQSTAAEMTLLQALKIDYFLSSRKAKSHVAAIIHDAIVLDMDATERHLLPSIQSLMEGTRFGKMKINCSEGDNLGSLKEVSTYG